MQIFEIKSKINYAYTEININFLVWSVCKNQWKIKRQKVWSTMKGKVENAPAIGWGERNLVTNLRSINNICSSRLVSSDTHCELWSKISIECKNDEDGRCAATLALEIAPCIGLHRECLRKTRLMRFHTDLDSCTYVIWNSLNKHVDYLILQKYKTVYMISWGVVVRHIYK